jgi:crossover junction endodeoxyribonuclease RuvC
MRVIGIDPGYTGAIAMFDGERVVVEDMPTVKGAVRGNDLNYATLGDMLSIQFSMADHAYIEQVGAMGSNQGASSVFKFGTVFGACIAVVAFSRIPYTLVPPNKWKAEMGLNRDKEKSRTRALQLFPKDAHFFSRKKDEGRAEAALIAWYGHSLLTKGKLR